MPNLQDLKIRINSVKSTQKITSAMKMVAAAKLRRAQEDVEAARAYAEKMERMVSDVGENVGGIEGAPPLLVGTGSTQIQLIVACTANRGLCGGFNNTIIRKVREIARSHKRDGKIVRILCVGRKGRDGLKRDFSGDIVETIEGIGRRGIEFDDARRVAETIVTMFDAGGFDVCTIVFNRFKSAMTQITTSQLLIPFSAPETADDEAARPDDAGPSPIFIFEPDEQDILADLLPRNLGVQVFQALLESAASEHGARMTSMDNATRNAGDMIDSLTLTYNRTRQAAITRELIEIISGAEAL